MDFHEASALYEGVLGVGGGAANPEVCWAGVDGL